MTPAAATDGRVGTSPRCDAAGRAGASPAVAHPAAEAAAAPALCGWVAPPPSAPGAAAAARLTCQRRPRGRQGSGEERGPAPGVAPRPRGGCGAAGALCGAAPGERRSCANTGAGPCRPRSRCPPPLSCPSRELLLREGERTRGKPLSAGTSETCAALRKWGLVSRCGSRTAGGTGAALQRGAS